MVVSSPHRIPKIRPESLGDLEPYAFDRRSVAPEATLSAVMPYMRKLGITRIADLTDLDVLGIPVAQAVRPNSRTNAVFQGKGTTPVLAKVSALMEAVETYHAEHILCPLRFAPMVELAARYPILRIDELPKDEVGRYHPDLDLLWIEGVNLVDCQPMWLPYECVHSSFVLPYPPGSGCFLSSTNGLASGNTPEEAIRHAICEVIERDATSVFLETVQQPNLHLTNINEAQHPVLKSLIRRIEETGIAIAVWDITSDLEVPAFRCLLIEMGHGPGLLRLPAEGCGCHPNKDVALLRAILEAVQARLTAIAGTRDDMGITSYLRDEDSGAMKAWRDALSEAVPARAHTDIITQDFPSNEAEVAWLLQKLASKGFDQVVSVDLTLEQSLPYAVVRVVIPGLEGPNEVGFVPGRRIRDRQRRGQ